MRQSCINPCSSTSMLGVRFCYPRCDVAWSTTCRASIDVPLPLEPVWSLWEDREKIPNVSDESVRCNQIRLRRGDVSKGAVGQCEAYHPTSNRWEDRQQQCQMHDRVRCGSRSAICRVLPGMCDQVHGLGGCRACMFSPPCITLCEVHVFITTSVIVCLSCRACMAAVDALDQVSQGAGA
jgi:hypothetical protein